MDLTKILESLSLVREREVAVDEGLNVSDNNLLMAVYGMAVVRFDWVVRDVPVVRHSKCKSHPQASQPGHPQATR